MGMALHCNMHLTSSLPSLPPFSTCFRTAFTQRSLPPANQGCKPHIKTNHKAGSQRLLFHVAWRHSPLTVGSVPTLHWQQCEGGVRLEQTHATCDVTPVECTHSKAHDARGGNTIKVAAVLATTTAAFLGAAAKHAVFAVF